ncbi:alpha/beta hydrolase [Pseudonocardia bannensis]|uniref:Alpha/beta hydrolase n=1 Tax=Pseudonocardia bannensis TaxID=630973 RepID=A0A848DS42_9PSEU|nr:alpha/beta hydrolase [Pseudonocardia bannensis]
MWIYRGRSGRTAIQSWCRQRLDNWALPHRRRQVSDEAPWEYRSAHLVVAGTQHRQTLVVLPGRHGNAAVMTQLLERLATRYRVVAVDLPGEAGLGSAGRPNTQRLRDYGRWLDALLARLAREAPEAVTVLAHGFGAAVALAAKPAPHIKGLVLLSPHGFTRPAIRIDVVAALLRWRIAPTAAAGARLLTRLAGPSFAPPAALVDWLRLVGRHVAMSTTPPAHLELAHRWRTTPVTVAVGEHDPLFGDGRLARPVRRALCTEVLTVPDVGALLPHERPDAVLAVLRAHAGLARDPSRDLHGEFHEGFPRELDEAVRRADPGRKGRDERQQDRTRDRTPQQAGHVAGADVARRISAASSARAGRSAAPHQAGRPPGRAARSRRLPRRPPRWERGFPAAAGSAGATVNTPHRRGPAARTGQRPPRRRRDRPPPRAVARVRGAPVGSALERYAASTARRRR